MGEGNIPGKYFLSQKGCKYGGSCKNVHSMNELSKGDRFNKCLNCGSEEHRAKDCERPNKANKPGPKEQSPKPGAQVAPVTSASSTSQPLSLARISSSKHLRCTVSSRHCRFFRPLNHCHCKLFRLLSHCRCRLPRRKAAAHSSHQAHHIRPWP